MDQRKIALLLRMEEVQQLTGWSRAKCYQMAASGEIPSVRSGRSIRVPVEPLMRWIEAKTTGGILAEAQ